MAEGEIRPPDRPVIEHWDGGRLLGRHWADRSHECEICSAPAVEIQDSGILSTVVEDEDEDEDEDPPETEAPPETAQEVKE